MKTIHVFVSGRVQGVFFRSTLKRVAEENRATGWVRNLEDGRVEALLQGEESNLNAVLEWCNQGPENAQVERLEREEIHGAETFRNFAILY